MRVFLEITIGQMCVFSPITTWVTKANHKLRIKQKKEVKVAQSYSTLCDPMDYTVHGNFQARILEWEAFPSPGYLPNPGIEPRPPALQADSLPAEPPGRPNVYSTVEMGLYSMLCASLDGRGVWGKMGTCIRIAEFFRCSSETITALLTGYNPIYNKKNFFKRSL